MKNKAYLLYRLIAISYIFLMGLIGIFRKHVGMLQGGDLFGDEAFAFGLFWLGVALILIFFDMLHLRRSRLSVKP